MAAYIRVPPCPPPQHNHHRHHQHHHHHSCEHNIETTVFAENQRHHPIRVETYEWVSSQEHTRPRHKTSKTERWVREQQEYPHIPPVNKMYTSMGKPEDLARAIDSYDAEARRYKRLQHELKKTVENMERERQKYREHLMASKLLRKQEEEEERRRRRAAAAASAILRERVVSSEERMRHVGLSIEDAFRQYDDRWQELVKSTTPIAFQDIPWPVLHQPRDPSNITQAQIAAFLLSSEHSPQLSRKDRIRSAQLRWHPDRFRRLMERVTEEDKEAVEDGAGVVARVLNELAASESVRNPRRSHTN